MKRICRQHLGDIRERNRARVGEGDRDHLIYYVLQSTAFTKLPPIEPALSAQEFAASGQDTCHREGAH